MAIVEVHPEPIGGPWVEGFVLDQHVISSRPVGYVAEHMQFERRFLADFAPPSHVPPGLVLTNPPYGRRVAETTESTAIYAELGQVLGERFRNWRAAFVSQDREHDRAVGLPVRREVPFAHGGLRCRLVEVEL